jgi:hypothetical protein
VTDMEILEEEIGKRIISLENDAEIFRKEGASFDETLGKGKGAWWHGLADDCERRVSVLKSHLANSEVWMH